MKNLCNIFIMSLLLGASLECSALSLRPGHHPVLDLGGFQSSQGKSQTIRKDGLVGDRYHVNDGKDTNALFGAGYLINWTSAPRRDLMDLAYGVNAFYLGKTDVKGTNFQELTMPNLGYKYSVSHLPVYLAGKANFKNLFQHYMMNRLRNVELVVNAGIGANFMKITDYKERSLDGVTLLDNAFASKNKTTLSATAGFGFSLGDIFPNTPLECGYRVFALGNSELKRNNPEVLDNLKTGNNFAHAVVCTAII